MSDTLTVQDLMAVRKKLLENCYPKTDYYLHASSKEQAEVWRRLFPGVTIVEPTPVEQRVSIEQIMKGQGH